jgi:hypothetical protein
MDKIERGFTMQIKQQKTSYGTSNCIELRTSKNPLLPFCDGLFTEDINLSRLTNDMLYCNVFLGFILSKNIKLFRHTLNHELKFNKLLPFHWNYNDNNEIKDIQFTIPRGEVFYFINITQHLQKYSKEWTTCLIKPPIVYNNINNTRYNISRDGHYTGCLQTLIPSRR